MIEKSCLTWLAFGKGQTFDFLTISRTSSSLHMAGKSVIFTLRFKRRQRIFSNYFSFDKIKTLDIFWQIRSKSNYRWFCSRYRSSLNWREVAQNANVKISASISVEWQTHIFDEKSDHFDEVLELRTHQLVCKSWVWLRPRLNFCKCLFFLFKPEK